MSQRSNEVRLGPLFWVGLLIGVPLIVVGVVGALGQERATKPFSLAVWVIGLALAHDLILAPLVCAIGLLMSRRLSGASRRIVQGASIVSGLVLLFAFPFIGGFGRDPVNPSLLPGNYAAGTAVILLGIWLVAGVMLWRHRMRS